MDPLTCSLAALVSMAMGGGSGPRALPVAMQDDALMLNGSPRQVYATARRMAALGASRVRLTASWSTLAPDPRSKQQPQFDARDSEAYPPEPWARLDRAVRAATFAGISPQVDVAFFAPRWAVKRSVWSRHPNRNRWEPNAGEFAEFAEAVARRYNGHHADPGRPGEVLPAVHLWTTWNEPNHPAFLLPQWTKANGHWQPHSPQVYRKLHRRAYAAIKAVDPTNRVLIGGLSPEGMPGRGARKAIAPLRFLRELACVDRHMQPLTTPACQNFKPLEADGFSQHPYSLYGPPDQPSKERDFARMGDLSKLSDLLQQLYDHGRTTSRLPIYITEYGYETNPPDVVRGVSLRTQARYLGHATFLAWQQPDIAMFAQFLMNDIKAPRGAGPIEASRDWHSGLYFADGRPKPAVEAFKLPFWAEARSVGLQDVTVLFGQIRPGAGRRRVQIEERDIDGVWHPIRTADARAPGDASCGGLETPDFLTDPQGFYLRVAQYNGPLAYRERWLKPDGTSELGVSVPVDEPKPLPKSS